MRSPWIDIEDKIGSIKGFAELQSIGFALDTVPTFDEQLTSALRIDLGDWREKIAWPSSIFDDPLARSAFYQERGLDTSLTHFPFEAFEQSIDVAGLRGSLPPDIPDYSAPSPHEGEQEIAFTRTNVAHDRLQRLETYMRHFIDQQMTTAFGENWIKHQIPGPMRQKWVDKQDKVKRARAISPHGRSGS